MKISLFLSILSLIILGACNDDLIIDANYKDMKQLSSMCLNSGKLTVG